MLFVFLLLLLCQSQGRQHNTNNNNNRTVACSSTDRVSMGVGELSVVNSESTPWSNTASAHVVQRREARQSTQNAHNNSGRASPLTTTRHSTPPQRWANSTATPYCFFGCFFDLDDLTFVGMVLLAVASALALTCFLATLGSLLLLTVYKRCCGRTSSSVKRAAVLVLGDVGRSPRMQYHAWSIAELNRESTNGVRFEVDLIGYTGEDCIERVRNNDAITLRRFTPLKKPSPKIPFILWAPFKVFAQLERLLCLLLFGIPTPDVLLVQTPPAIPTLFVAIVACAITGARLVVDWHNFGYTILQINLKSARHPFVRVAYWYERVLAKFSSGNFCVTDAMRDWLAAQWGVTAAVLHDQPPDFFHRTAIGDMHRLFRKFETNPASGLKRSIFGTYFDDGSGGGGADESTLLTVVDAATGEPRLRDDRPAMVVSSTSWTEDEDFGILLDAIVALDKLVSAEADVHTVDGGDAPSFPRLLVVVTGKGPQKAMYEARMAQMQMRYCRVVTAWLEAEDYPTLLGCCDLGVSLHYSSSGLDLPMKVLDMFGAGMPVCAVDFACLSELVRNDVNGLTFAHKSGAGSGAQLARQLYDLFAGFPNRDTRLLDRLRAGVQPGSWHDNWVAHAQDVLFPKYM